MNYVARLSQEALNELAGLQLSVTTQSAFFDCLQELETDPTGKYRRPVFPFARVDNCMHQFWVQESEGKRFFTVFFHFDQDERTFVVTHVGHVLYDN